MLLHHCIDSVGHSGPLGLWPPPLSSLLLPSPFFWFHLSLNPVGHSGPLGSWQPLFLFSHSPSLLCHHSPISSLPLGLNGSFRPTRSLATSSLFLASAFLPLSPKPEPSRSFRPTRVLATSHLLPSSTFPGLLVITATTQSVIPAHSVTGFTSEHCAGQRHGNAALVMCRCDKFGVLGTGAGREGRVMIFASLAILRVFSSLPVFGLSVLLCWLWSFWLGALMSFQESTDLNECAAHSKFLTCHLCFGCPSKCRLSDHLRITRLAPRNI